MYADTTPDQTAHIHVQKGGHTDAHGDRKKKEQEKNTDANKAVIHMLTQILIVILLRTVIQLQFQIRADTHTYTIT